MSSQSGSGIERLKSVRFGFGCINDFPEVDVHFMTKYCQFVHQTNINVAIGIFKYFFHFGDCRTRNCVNIAIKHGAIHGCNYFQCFVSNGSHNFGCVFCFVNQISRIDPLRRKAEIEILTAYQPRTCFKNWFDEFFRSTRIGSGFKYHHRTFFHITGNGFGRWFHVTYIRLLVHIQRRGHANSHKINIADKTEIVGGRKHSFSHNFFQIVVHHIANVVMTGIYHVHFCFLHIETDGFESGFGFFNGKRQSYISEAYHSHNDFALFNFFQYIFFYHALYACCILLIGYFQLTKIQLFFQKRIRLFWCFDFDG